MDYLKAFIIGTSGLVFFPHLFLLYMKDDKYYDYSFKIYSLIVPIYYGLMSVLALYIGNKFNLSLDLRLFITSIISIVFVVSINYFIFSQKYKPYKNYTTKDWVTYIINNGLRHLVAFNVIIYFFSKYYDKNWALKVFIIGSSIIVYYNIYLQVIWADKKNKVNYDYKLFATFEPITYGIRWVICLYILHKIMKLKLINSMVIVQVISSLVVLYLAHKFKTYGYENYEWFEYFSRNLIPGLIKIIPMYILITR